MLYHLFNKINTIFPICGITENEESIEVKYYEDNLPSESQLSTINEIVNFWPIQKLQINKLEALDNNWKIIIKSGWETGSGYRLGIDISDVALLSGAFALAKEANSFGINDPINIVDIQGQSHSMNLEEFTLLMLQYGQARAALSNSYATIKQSINSASSIEELEAININI